MVELVPLEQEEFKKQTEVIKAQFAQWAFQSGESKENESYEYSRKMLDSLLPEGFNTPLNYFYRITENGEPAGFLWFRLTLNRDLPEAEIMYLSIVEEKRKKGMGLKSILRLEEFLREKGIANISLKMPGQNQTAYSIFKKAGYSISEIKLRKEISPVAGDQSSRSC
jgi:ribosomal protein S18 acetylase RimI-like enzyme